MRLLFFILSLLFINQVSSKDKQTKAIYQLSTHILDITKGKSAENVDITLEKRLDSNEWKEIDKNSTDKNGRITNF